MIRLVTFDLDNTLWETDNTIRRAESEMRAVFSRRVPDFSDRFDFHATQALREQVIADTPEIAHDVSRLRTEVLFRAARECGCSEDDARAYAEEAFDVFLDARHRISYLDGALDLLKTLKPRYILVSLTNGNADFLRLGLDRFFSFGFTAADVGAMKPHRAMFDAALEQAGIAASNAVHVGDQPIDDVQGAKDVGMHTIWFNPDGAKDTVGASAEVSRLLEIPQVIARLKD
ncbi:MAG: HAD-IA family hydrolase [bacterium]|nr:HAD-IA family hydrolase [bacterium]